jgi:hypothetical protein
MKSLLIDNREKKTLIDSIAAAVKRRISRHYQRSSERICSQAFEDLKDGVDGNDLSLGLETVVDYRHPSDDTSLSMYQAILARLGYGDDAVFPWVLQSGGDSPIHGYVSDWTIQEFHVKKNGSDAFGIGTTTEPFRSIGEAFRRLPLFIQDKITIFVHPDPDLDGENVQTVYTISDGDDMAILRSIKFGQNGSLAVVGLGEPVQFFEDPATEIYEIDIPEGGTRNDCSLGMISHAHRGRFLVNLEDGGQGDLPAGFAVPIADNDDNAFYTRGFRSYTQASPRRTAVIAPRVVVEVLKLEILLEGFSSPYPKLGFFNLEINFAEMNGFLHDQYPFTIAAIGAKQHVFFDFCSIHAPIEPVLPNGEVILLRNSRVNYGPFEHAHFKPTAQNTGNSLLINWINSELAGDTVDFAGLSIGDPSVEVDISPPLTLTVDQVEMDWVSCSRGVNVLGRSTLLDGASGRIQCVDGPGIVEGWALTGFDKVPIFVVGSNIELTYVWFFDMMAHDVFNSIVSERSTLSVKHIGCESSITGYAILDLGQTHFLAPFHDGIDLSTFIGTSGTVMFWVTDDPQLVWPGGGTCLSDGCGSIITRG